jgi:thiosulfate dehydrogenase [quinone] large subunit
MAAMTSPSAPAGRQPTVQGSAVAAPWLLGPDWSTGGLKQPGWLLLPLRGFLGVTFTFAALQKLSNRDFFNASSPTSVQHQMSGVARASPIGPLVQLSLHMGPVVGLLIALGELTVGVGTLLGLRARIAATGGALLALSFFLTVSWSTTPYYYGADIVFLFAWTPFIAMGAAGVLSTDAWLAWPARTTLFPASSAGAAKPTAIRARERRAVVVAGTGTLALAAVAAAAGRLLGAHTKTTTASTGPSPKAHHLSPSTGSRSPAASPSHAPAGTKLASVAAVPPGRAKQFTDPASGNPAWVVCLAQGKYAAFSAVCTHAGCTVNYDASNSEFVCPCHGGAYSARTGHVLSGPPPGPLPPIPVKVTGGQIYRT